MSQGPQDADRPQESNDRQHEPDAEAPAEDRDQQAPQDAPEAREAVDFPVVGVGASAGGLEAFEQLLRQAVSNAVAHSGARGVEIVLESDGSATAVTVSDDGSGLPPGGKRGPGMGLQIMRHRAGLIGGELVIESPSTGGTRVTCRVLGKTT